MSKRYSLLAIISALTIIILIYIAYQNRGNPIEMNIEETYFSELGPIDNYTEFLYYKNRVYGISSVVIDEDVFKGKIGRKVGQINNIDIRVKQSGDIGVVNDQKEFMFKTGDGVYRANVTHSKLRMLIKTSQGYLYAKLLFEIK